MKIQPRTMPVEVKIRNRWVRIEEHLTFAEHERNAEIAGATEVRTLDRTIHKFIEERQK